MNQNALGKIGFIGFSTWMMVATATNFGIREANAQDTTPQGTFDFEWVAGSDGSIDANSNVETILDAQYQVGQLRITGFTGSVSKVEVVETDSGPSTMEDPDKDHIDDSKYYGYGGSGANENKVGGDLKFGTWYMKQFNCPQELCYSLVFLPNASEIIKLEPGDSVTSKFSYIRQQVVQQAPTLKFNIVGKQDATVTINRKNLTSVSLVSMKVDSIDVYESDATTSRAKIDLVVDPPNLTPSLRVNYTISNNASEGVDKKEITAAPQDYIAPRPIGVSESIVFNSEMGLISIPIVNDQDHEGIEAFVVELEPGNGYLRVKGKTTTTVRILDNDAPEITPADESCVHDFNNIPLEYTENSWVKVFFDNPPSATGENPSSVYWPAKINNSFQVQYFELDFVKTSYDPKLVVEEGIGAKRIFYVHAYDRNNHDSLAKERIFQPSLGGPITGHAIGARSPAGFRGYLRYRLLPRSGDTWYEVAQPCEFHVWWVDSHSPGIELNVSRDSVPAGGSTLVTVSATPVPSRDINVRIEVDNTNQIISSGDIFATIKAGQKSATVKLDTHDEKVAEKVKISAGWSSDYWVDEVVGTKEITIVGHSANLVNFAKEHLNVDVSEDSTAEIPIKLKNPNNEDVTVNYQIVEMGAKAGEDFILELPPALNSLTVHQGMQDAFISIPILENDDETELTERFKVVLVDSDSVKADYNNEALVSINTSVRPVVTYPAQSCDAGIQKPENAPDPHIVTYFTESRPNRVYYAPNWTHYSPFFRFELSNTGEAADLQGTKRRLYMDEISPEGGAPRQVHSDLGANASVGRFQFKTPGDRGRGPFIYRMTPRDADNSSFTTVRLPCEYFVWVVDTEKPGISMSFKQSIAGLDEKITLRATAHPAPAHDITVPFTLSDPSLVQTPNKLEITIERGKEFGEVDLTTSILPQGSNSAELSATVEYRSNFWLDDSVDTARLIISRNPDFSVEFTEDSVNSVVNESKGDLKLKVRLSQTPISPVTVHYTVDDGSATSGSDFEIPNWPEPTKITIGPGETIGIISIPILSEDGQEENETFTVKLTGTEEGAIVGANANANVTILDTKEPIVYVSVPEKQKTVLAGDDAVFTVHTFPPPSENLSIPFMLSQQQNVVSFNSPKTITIIKGLISTIVRVPTDNGTTNTETNGSITLTLLDADGYNLLTDDLMPSEDGTSPATVTVNHNANPVNRYSVAFQVIRSIILDQTNISGQQSKAPSLKPLLRIQSENPIVTEGEIIEFKISVAGGNTSPENLKVSVKVTEEGDFIGGGFSRTVSLTGGKSETGFSISTIDDNLAEYDASVTATLLKGAEYELDSQFSASVLVTDNADREARNSRIGTANRDVLPDLMAALSERSLDTTSLRVSQAFSGNVESNIQLGGQSTPEGLLTAGGEAMNDEEFDWRPILGNSSLVLNLSPEGNGSNFGTIWAFGDHRTVSKNDSRLDQSWSGELLTGHMGFDTIVGEDSLFGFSAFVSETEADYDLLGDAELAYAVQTNGIQPYLAYSSPNDDVLVQASAGYGTGEIAIDEDEYDTLILDSTFHMMTLRGSHRLFHSESTLARTKSLNIIGEGWMAGQFAQSNEEYIGDLYSKVRHLRLVAEGTGSRNLPGGASLKQEASVGMLHNSKDNQSTIDLELTSSLDYLDPVGVDVSLSGRTLVDKFEETREWILRTTLNADFGKDRTGVLLKVSPSLAWLRGSSDTSLWNRSLVADRFDTQVNEDGFAVNSEIGYGFAAFDDSGLITPYGGFNMAQNQRKSIHLGNRIAVNPHFNLGLESTYTIPEKDFYGYGTELNGRFQW